MHRSLADHCIVMYKIHVSKILNIATTVYKSLITVVFSYSYGFGQFKESFLCCHYREKATFLSSD